MELSSRYDIGQEVWHVWDRIAHTLTNCTVCGAAGKVRVLGSEELISCPKCWGKGEVRSDEQYTEYVVSHAPLTIGQAQVKVEGPTAGDDGYGFRSYAVDQSNMGPRSYKREEAYMCRQTGVGSGRVYRVEDLFPTREEAEAEALARTQASIENISRYDEVPA